MCGGTADHVLYFKTILNMGLPGARGGHSTKKPRTPLILLGFLPNVHCQYGRRPQKVPVKLARVRKKHQRVDID